MDPYYATKMANKTEPELLEYFSNHHKYLPAAVLAAVNELQNRGRTFTEAELATLEAERLAVQQTIAEETVPDQEEDYAEVDAPQLYSPSAILGFSIFFSLLFGAMLLATNLRQIGNRRGSWVVIGFSLVYMLVEVILLYQLKRSSTLSVGMNLIGAFILNFYFWPKYIGFQRPYEAKPIWRALIISVLIVLPLILILTFVSPPK